MKIPALFTHYFLLLFNIKRYFGVAKQLIDSTDFYRMEVCLWMSMGTINSVDTHILENVLCKRAKRKLVVPNLGEVNKTNILI